MGSAGAANELIARSIEQRLLVRKKALMVRRENQSLLQSTDRHQTNISKRSSFLKNSRSREKKKRSNNVW